MDRLQIRNLAMRPYCTAVTPVHQNACLQHTQHAGKRDRPTELCTCTCVINHEDGQVGLLLYTAPRATQPRDLEAPHLWSAGRIVLSSKGDVMQPRELREERRQRSVAGRRGPRGGLRAAPQLRVGVQLKPGSSRIWSTRQRIHSCSRKGVRDSRSQPSQSTLRIETRRGPRS